jgi:hypothetical protein
MDERWQTLPRELVHRILAYDGRITYRHGVYVNRLNLSDDMYWALCRIPRLEVIPDTLFHRVFFVRVRFSDGVSCMEKRVSEDLLSYLPHDPLFAEYYGFTEHYALFFYQGCPYTYHREYRWSWTVGRLHAWITERIAERIGELVGPVFRAVVRFLQHI